MIGQMMNNTARGPVSIFRRIRRPIPVGMVMGLFMLASQGCQKPPPKPQPLGKPLTLGPVRKLAASPDGSTAIFVADAKLPPEKDAPPSVYQGVLTTVATSGGAARQLGGGVSTLDDAYRVSPDGGYLAFLQAFRFQDQSGNLLLAPTAGGDGRVVAQEVTFYKFSADGRYLGYVAAQSMHLLNLKTNADRVIASPVTSFEFAPDSKYILARKPIKAGGHLLLTEVDSDLPPRQIGENVGEYGFAPSGNAVAFTARETADKPYALFIGSLKGGKFEKYGEGVSTFVFSPNGQWVAFVDSFGPERNLGMLRVVSTANNGPAKKLGENVVEYRWSPNAQTIAFRENNEQKGRKWISLKVATVPGDICYKEDWVPNEKVDRIPLVWNSSGTHLAYMHMVNKPELSVDLFLLSVADKKSRNVAHWAFGFQFSPDDKELWYRGHCVRNGRACDLLTTNLANEATPPRKLADGVLDFKIANAGDRLLLMYPRLDSETACDLAYIDLKTKQASKTIDYNVLPGALFANQAGTAVIYAIGDRQREGAYLAAIP